MDMAMHNVKVVSSEVRKIESKTHEQGYFFVRKIEVRTDDGERATITLFSDDRQTLSFQ